MKTTKTILVLSCLAMACGGSEDGTTSCANAIGNIYSAECTMLAADGSPIDERSAVLTCINGTVEAETVGGTCPRLMETWKSCLLSIYNDCESCNDEFRRLLTCN